MSHFSTVKTRMVRREFLEAALKDLGYVPEVGTSQIRGFGGNRTAVEIRVRTKNPAYDIGFRRAGDAYEIVADWWGITETTQDRFFRDLAQRYAYRAVRAELEIRGQFSVASETVDAEGRIHVVLRRTV
jgi:hypothetical protein